jgi:hypothetical protein
LFLYRAQAEDESWDPNFFPEGNDDGGNAVRPGEDNHLPWGFRAVQSTVRRDAFSSDGLQCLRQRSQATATTARGDALPLRSRLSGDQHHVCFGVKFWRSFHSSSAQKKVILVEVSLTQLTNTGQHGFVINSFLLALSQIRCSMDFGDDFNNFVVNGMIDLSSSDDDDNFYFDGMNIVATVS